MISEAEVRRTAALTKVDPMVIDLDYSLGWFLLGMQKTSESMRGLIFKGGTCLRKCYFADYRFSEDLDFSATQYLSLGDIKDWVTECTEWIADHDGPDFRIQPIHLEVVNDDYGSESYQARIYYRGPLRWGGSPRTVKLDVTRAEKVMLPIFDKQIQHPYSDQASFADIGVSCYCLEEVVAEKFRAIGGQRRFAVSRDLYDIYNLISIGINLDAVKQILPQKFLIKGISLDELELVSVEQRRLEFKRDWERRLSYLVIDNKLNFETVWLSVLQCLSEIKQKP